MIGILNKFKSLLCRILMQLGSSLIGFHEKKMQSHRQQNRISTFEDDVIFSRVDYLHNSVTERNPSYLRREKNQRC